MTIALAGGVPVTLVDGSTGAPLATPVTLVDSAGGIVSISSLANIAAYLATATLPAGIITTSQPMTLTQTWNAAGVTFTGFKVNITDTASAAGSLLMDLQLGGGSVAKITKFGVLTLASSPDSGAGSISFQSGGVWPILGRSAGGHVSLTDQGGAGITCGLAIGTAGVLIADASNILALKSGNSDQTQRWYSTNAAYAQIQSLSESTTLSGATTDTAIQFPALCVPLGVTVRVTTLITGATTFNVGDAASATRYGTGLAVAANTTNAQAGTTNPVIPSAGTKVRFTAVGGAASFSAGVVRVTLHYISLSAATS